jgi:hypothetical protein
VSRRTANKASKRKTQKKGAKASSKSPKPSLAASDGTSKQVRVGHGGPASVGLVAPKASSAEVAKDKPALTPSTEPEQKTVRKTLTPGTLLDYSGIQVVRTSFWPVHACEAQCLPVAGGDDWLC